MDYEMQGAVRDLVHAIRGNAKANEALDELARQLDTRNADHRWAEQVARERSSR